MRKTIRKEIIHLALPTMLENILHMLMGVIDNFLVAQISMIAISGVAVANSILAIYQALFIALAAAVSSLVARSMGNQQKDQKENIIHQAISLAVILSVLVGIASLLFGRVMLAGLGASSSVVDLGYAYLAIVGGFYVTLGIMMVLGAVHRAQGDARTPMLVSLLSNLINVLLSSIFLYIFHMGIIGIAMSTVLARVIGIVILIKLLPIKWQFKKNLQKWDSALIGLMIPSTGERLMMRLGDVLITMIVVKLGTSALAGNAIGETLSQFNYMPGLAISTAVIIMTAKEVGNRQYGKIEVIIKEAYLLTVVTMLLIACTNGIFSFVTLNGFTDSHSVQAAARIVLIYSIVCTPATAGTLIYTALWQGLGNAKLPFYATTVGMWLIRIGLGFALGIVMNLGLQGVWLATILDNLVRWFFLKYSYQKNVKVTR